MAEDGKSGDGDEGFKAKHFLEMPEERQKFWIHGAMNMLGISVALMDKPNGKCLYNWYFNDKMSQQNWLIFETMKKNPDVDPASVLIFLATQECKIYWK